MVNRTFGMSRQRVAAQGKRIFLTAVVALMLSVSFVVCQEPVAVYAAPSGATSGRQDRRPDRERPVATSTATPSQGSSGSGLAQNGSSGSTTSQARPRLVRR